MDKDRSRVAPTGRPRAARPTPEDQMSNLVAVEETLQEALRERATA
jgi:hypothetical protein